MPNSAQLEGPGKTVREINLVSTFLANSQLTSLEPPIVIFRTSHTLSDPVPSNIAPIHIHPSTIIVAPSAVLHQAHAVFSFLQTYCSQQVQRSSIRTVVLTGGVGHSTEHLYSAIRRHEIYSKLPSLIGRDENDLSGLSEAELFYLIFVHFFDGKAVMDSWNHGEGLNVLVEGKSTNCGANAKFSRTILEDAGVRLGDGQTVDDVVIVQDPTMSLRTKATFEKVFEDKVKLGRVRFWTWPTFVPCVKIEEAAQEQNIMWNLGKMQGLVEEELWDLKRFYGLILGEISRLRDDEYGYGPKGKQFIVHVDVPVEVEDAWRRLCKSLDFQR